MTWVAYLYDTVSGQLAQEIDIPSFTWSMTVSDSSFSTTKDKGVGDDEVSGLELPWTQIPGDDPAARAAALQPYSVALCCVGRVCWMTPRRWARRYWRARWAYARPAGMM